LTADGRIILLAERGAGLVGFAELLLGSIAPAYGVVGSEIVRLYVQPHAQGRGVRKALLSEAEVESSRASAPAVWLTAWEKNERALRFYGKNGYVDVGKTLYTFEGNDYPNRLLIKRFARED